MLAFMLLSLHNVTELIQFTVRIRESILGDRFVEEFGEWLEPEPSHDRIDCKP
jgi:queuine tRNA-ribosyltransferase